MPYYDAAADCVKMRSISRSHPHHPMIPRFRISRRPLSRLGCSKIISVKGPSKHQIVSRSKAEVCPDNPVGVVVGYANNAQLQGPASLPIPQEYIKSPNLSHRPTDPGQQASVLVNYRDTIPNPELRLGFACPQQPRRPVSPLSAESRYPTCLSEEWT